jgi:hypothetical protein
MRGHRGSRTVMGSGRSTLTPNNTVPRTSGGAGSIWVNRCKDFPRIGRGSHRQTAKNTKAPSPGFREWAVLGSNQ